jgi:hypothetical protein
LKQHTSQHRPCRCLHRRLLLERAEEEMRLGEAHDFWAHRLLLLPWAFSSHGLSLASVTWRGRRGGVCRGSSAGRAWSSWHERERERERERWEGKEGGGY